MIIATSIVLQAAYLLALCSSCQTQPLEIDPEPMARYSERMETPDPDKQPETSPATGSPTTTPSSLVGKIASGEGDETTLVQKINEQLPDPEEARRRAESELGETTSQNDANSIRGFLELLKRIDRPKKLRLSLDDALRRTVTNSFAIRVSSYNPAIATARVVEAEAAFDATFFADITNNKVDQPTASTIVGSQIQTFEAQSGIRKLLPSGMQVQTDYLVRRSSNNFVFQQLNPQWINQFAVQFRQPLLRGFGIDFNRSQIRLEKLGRKRDNYQFKQDVRDTLRSTESAYWRLVQARRTLVVSAKLLTSFQQIFDYLKARGGFDVYPIQLADTRARLEASKADFIRLMANVRNAEDQLITLINDPTVDLADDIEIIPTDFPAHQALVIDRIAEVQTALENRAEIARAKLGIDVAKIQVGVAKNQALPKLDVSFRYTVSGLGASQDRAFDEVTKNDFHEYFVGINYELPFGNRAARARLTQAKLQHGQAIAALKQTFEEVIFEVNQAVRTVQATHDLIEPSVESAIATQDQVDSIIARALKRDYLTLNNELNTRQALAQARADVLSNLVNYAVAIIDLERAKGTLLTYNGVQFAIDDTGAD